MRLLPLLLLTCLAGCSAGDPSTVVVQGEARSADGVPIRYDVRGAGEPTIVLVHGWMNTRGIWGEHPATLARTHRVVNLELAGHGQSGAARDVWTMDAFGEDIAAVVAQVGAERVVLVGFSMGGAAVLEAAARMPERVDGIVFIDTFHDPDRVPDRAMLEGMESQFRSAWGDTAFLRAFALTPDAPDSLVRYIAASLPERPREHWFDIVHAYGDWMNAELVPTLRRIDAPVAAINTTNFPTNVAAMRRYVPSFTVDTMAGLGHAGILLRRVDDFDRRLLAIIERFTASPPAGGGDDSG